MKEEVFIHIRRGLSSYKFNITGWKAGEWVEGRDGERKRLLIAPDGITYQDYAGADSKHHLIRIEDKNERRQLEKENSQLKEKVKDNNISLDEKESAELLLYKYIVVMGIDFCTDQFGNEAGVYKNKYYTLNGKEFKSLIAEVYFEEKGKVFNESIWKKVISVLTAKCAHKTTYFPLRCHTQDSKVYYDDGFMVWEFENGKYRMHDKDSTQCPVIFRRYSHQLPANVSVNERSTKLLLKEITTLFNIQDFREEAIVPMFSSEHPEPMKLFTGDPGAAKSTLTLFIKRLVDPDQVERLSLPDKNNLADFSMHRQHFYVILYDNIRDFTREQSDQLCMMITGSTGIKRALFTNGDLHISKGLPRIIGNGLRPEPSNFNDLLDRTLLIDMQRIENSRPEKEVWNKMNHLIEQLRFCCLRDVSMAIYQPPPTNEDLPRMSEYCLLAENTSRLWFNPENDFIKWFSYRMEVSHATGMDDPLMIVLEAYLKENRWALKGEGLKMTGSDWRLRLLEWASTKLDLGTDVYGGKKEGQFLRKDMYLLSQEKEFPGNATWMGRRFRDLSPLLKVKGFKIDVIRTSDDRSIRIFINE